MSAFARSYGQLVESGAVFGALIRKSHILKSLK